MTNVSFRLPSECGDLASSVIATTISNITMHLTDAEISVYTDKPQLAVNAKSILGLTSLRLKADDELHFNVLCESNPAYTTRKLLTDLQTVFSK